MIRILLLFLLIVNLILNFLRNCGGGSRRRDRPGANRRDDDLSQKGLVVSCFAARAAAQPDFIHPMGFEGLGTERVFRPAGAFQGAAAP